MSHAIAGDGDDGGTRTVTKTVTPTGKGHFKRPNHIIFDFPNISNTVTGELTVYASRSSVR